MTANARTLTARPLVDFSPLLAGWAPTERLEQVGLGVFELGLGVDCEGAIYVAAQRSSEGHRDPPPRPFAKTMFVEPTDYLVLRWKAGEVRSTVVSNERLVVAYVQPLRESLLLVGTRCRWRPEGPERNAIICDWNGKHLASLTLGDGIASVRTTPDDVIWVSYWDEGVFGNYGWGGPTGSRPLGTPGLVAFSRTGDVRFAYDSDVACAGPLYDAYATNVVADDDVWTYYYDDFPIVRIFDGQYRVWSNSVSGAHALAVEDQRVLLLGDYENPSLARVLELQQDGASTVVGQYLIQDASGRPLGDARAFGVGRRLYLFRERLVMVVEDW